VTTENVTTDGTALTVTATTGDYTGKVFDLTDGTVDVTAGVNVTTENVTTSGTALTVTATTGDYQGGVFDLTDGTVDVTAGVNVTTDDVTNVGAKLTLEATAGDYTGKKFDLSGGSDTHITAGKNATTTDTNVQNSALAAATGDDYRFDRIDGKGGSVIIDAKGVVGRLLPDGADAIIFFDEADDNTTAWLSVSGAVSVGEEKSHLKVDIPETLTMHVPLAGDIWIDAVGLNDQPARQFTGRGEDGAMLTGDVIDEMAGADTAVGVELDVQTPEAIADLLLKRALDDADQTGKAGELLKEVTRAVQKALAPALDTPQQEEAFGQMLEKLGTTPAKLEKDLGELKTLLEALEETNDPAAEAQREKNKKRLGELLDQLLVLALRTPEADEDEDPAGEPAEPPKPLLADDDLIPLYWAALTEEEKLALAEEKLWEEVEYPEPAKDDRDFRDFHLDIGESTGASSVTNLGSITITQAAGTFTAREVTSGYEDVTITAPAIAGAAGVAGANVTGTALDFTATTGGIEGLTVDQRDWVEHTVVDMSELTQAPAAMPAAGESWTIIRNAATGLLEMNFQIDFTTISVDDHHTATTLTALAVGDISITEVQGDLGLAKAESTNGGDILLAVANGDLVDVNTAPDGLNISTAGNAAVTAPQGAIGAGDDPLHVSVGGTLTTLSQGDTWVTTPDDLTLVADILDENAHLDVLADKDLTVSNTRGDLNAARLHAEDDLSVTSPAGSTHVNELKAGGALTMASAGDITVDKAIGDVTVNSIRAQGSVAMNIQGQLTDLAADPTAELAQAQTEAGRTEARQEALEEQLAAHQGYLDELTAEKEELEQTLARLETEMQALDLALEEALLEGGPNTAAIRQLEQKLETLEEEKQALTDELLQLEQTIAAQTPKVDALKDQLKAAEQANAAAQAALEKARETLKQSGAASLTAGENVHLVLENGGSVGRADNAFGVDVGGVLNITAGQGSALQGVWLESPSDKPLSTGPIQAQQIISIQTAGDIAPAGSADPAWDGLDYTAPDLVLNSTSGDTGSAQRYIETMADTIAAMGDNVYIHNHKDTELGPITAEEEASIRSDGDITAGPDPEDSVVAGSIDLQAKGDVGSEDDPIHVESDTISARGDNIYLKSHGDVVADRIVANKDVTIVTDGSVYDVDGGPSIVADNLTVEAGGHIGAKDNPLNIQVGGKVSLTAGIPGVFWSNSHRDKWTEKANPVQAVLPPAPKHRWYWWRLEQQEPEPVQPQPAADPAAEAPAGPFIIPIRQAEASGYTVLALAALAALALVLLLVVLGKRRKKEQDQPETQVEQTKA
ncbi:MAG TPA: hypothetical protein H9795_02865, partial [Candidatus Fournierella merdigallinarum]|nr:hypothetical protein [Candidatus Fournierella merdigallinarum]